MPRKFIPAVPRRLVVIAVAVALASLSLSGAASAQQTCQKYGPAPVAPVVLMVTDMQQVLAPADRAPPQ